MDMTQLQTLLARININESYPSLEEEFNTLLAQHQPLGAWYVTQRINVNTAELYEKYSLKNELIFGETQDTLYYWHIQTRRPRIILKKTPIDFGRIDHSKAVSTTVEEIIENGLFDNAKEAFHYMREELPRKLQFLSI